MIKGGDIMKQFLNALLTILMQMMTKETFDIITDKILDIVEEWAEGDPATTDDDRLIVLSLCSKIRAMLNIPDNDEPAAQE